MKKVTLSILLIFTLSCICAQAGFDLARQVDLPVIASGGVKGLDDIRVLSLHAGEGIEGVITGRALYDGRLDLAAAIAMAQKG